MTSIVKQLYRSVLPTSVRGSSLVAKLKSQLLGHNLIYDAEYYAGTVEEPAIRSAGRMATSIVATFHPNQVIDVGCGTGALLAALRDQGCDVFGLEYSDAALQYCRNRQLNVAQFNLEKDKLVESRTFDVAVSMEVAEHLPATVADRYVDLLTQLSSTIVFTAAPPGQGGADHVNEQPPAYWITKFQARGFHYEEELSLRWRHEWQSSGDVENWYYRNLMIFKR